MSFMPAQREISRSEFIALMAAMMALNALAIDIMLPALPYMGEALNIMHENDRQWVISAYMLGFGVSQLAIGPLSDRFGRRNPMLVGVIIYIIAAIAAIFAPNFFTLLILRVAQGMGAAGTRVITTSIVRDKFSGRAMAEVMSLIFMVFMVIPILAPGIGQIILLTGPWQYIFIFMAGLAAVFGIWAYFRLPETLLPANRRPLTFNAVIDGFRIVFTNRVAIMYGLAGTFMFGALFGFITSSQQIYVDIFELGPYFPVAFAAIACLMSLASFLNSRIVNKYGMRRISHLAMLIFIAGSALWFGLTLVMDMPLWLFLPILGVIMFTFGWASSNMNSLSMEPLGAVAGTASSVFGSIQTVGGAILGSFIGYSFDGTLTPTAAGFLALGLLTLVSVLIAERGRLFGTGAEFSRTDFSHSEAH